MGEKKLYRSSENKKICGVCAGLAAYFDLDVTIMRLIFLLLMFVFGGGLLAYLICALIMPVQK